MTYQSEVLADSPLLYWRLGDASGTSATDSSGAGKHGTYVGSPTLGVTGLVAGDTAVTLNGSTQYVNYADPTNLSSAFTIEAWIKSVGPAGYIAARWPSTSSWRNFYLTLNGGRLNLEVRNSGGTSAAISSPGAGGLINDNVAHHVAATFGSGTIKIYIDGALSNSASLSGSLAGVGGVSDLTVGALRAGVIDFNGTIDEVAYYSTELSSGRIAAHYAAASPPPQQNITPAHIASVSTVFSPTITPGTATITPAHISSTSQVFAPTIGDTIGRDITVEASIDGPVWTASIDSDPWATAELDQPEWTTRIEAS